MFVLFSSPYLNFSLIPKLSTPRAVETTPTGAPKISLIDRAFLICTTFCEYRIRETSKPPSDQIYSNSFAIQCYNFFARKRAFSPLLLSPASHLDSDFFLCILAHFNYYSWSEMLHNRAESSEGGGRGGGFQTHTPTKHLAYLAHWQRMASFSCKNCLKCQRLLSPPLPHSWVTAVLSKVSAYVRKWLHLLVRMYKLS